MESDAFDIADNDGIPDVIEIAGMRTQSGQTIKTDPNNPDCDGDGLKDGEEIILNFNDDSIYFTMKSNPMKVDNFRFEQPDNEYYHEDSIIYKTIVASGMSNTKNATLNLYSIDGDVNNIYSQGKIMEGNFGYYHYYFTTYELEYKTKTEWIEYINKEYFIYIEFIKPTSDLFSFYGEANGANPYLSIALSLLSAILPDVPERYAYISDMCTNKEPNEKIPICMNVKITHYMIDKNNKSSIIY